MDDPDVIRGQMENTRNSISEKLEILEDRVSTSVQDATQEVSDTVETVTDSVQETVATVKETVADTLSAVRDSVDTIKSIFDISDHVDRHPWFVLGGSVALGYVLGELVARKAGPPVPSPPEMEMPTQNSPAPAVHAHNGRASSPGDHGGKESAPAEGLLDLFAPDLGALKGLAIGALMGTVREMVAEAAGESFGQPLSEIIDSVTRKMGGTPMPSRPHHDMEASAAETATAEAGKGKLRFDSQLSSRM